MKTLQQIFVAILVTVFCSCAEQKVFTEKDIQNNKSDLKLWYNAPAKSWSMDALPIGNGYLGAMFFGKVYEERIQFNEESLWTGGKGSWEDYNGGNRPGAYRHLPEIRRLIEKGNYKDANTLAKKELIGKIKNVSNGHFEGFGAFQPFGDLLVTSKSDRIYQDYRRELDISNGVGYVQYKANGITFERTYFASYPKHALVFQFKNNSNEGVDYEVNQDNVGSDSNMSFENNQLIISGELIDNGMAFESRLLIDSDGEISFTDKTLHVRNAKYLNLYLTAATDYVNDYPNYKGKDFIAQNKKIIESLKQSNYEAVLKEHIADFSALHNRVHLSLGNNQEQGKIPTNNRLDSYAKGGLDPSLEALYFQYGRYLLISSSRPGTLPANLQGKWNDRTAPAWASDYHANINVQMIYWPAESANLAECHEPLIEYIDKLREPGSQTAKDFFNARGWVVNTMNNTFGYTAPGWGFPWGFFPAGAAWLTRHAWEHYKYSNDKIFLAEKAYPLIKDAALFWLDYLSKDEHGHLVSFPSYSPEHGEISAGAYMDIQIVWDLFHNCMQAHDILGIDDEFSKQIEIAHAKLLPLKIGNWGQLQEWKEDVDDPENKHRHVSHLYALYPSNQISTNLTSSLAEAAKVSLDARGDEGTGWALGWKINLWARLHNGDRAYKMLRRAMKLSLDDGWGEKRNMLDGGGVYSNLLSTHPPFQLDGNMGVTAGIIEMLLQSHDDNTIDLLPALPSSWKEGTVSGLKARGGYEVSFTWAASKLVSVTIHSKSDGFCKVKNADIIKRIELKANQIITLNATLDVIP
ncbi:glycoside hydrolase family 95 protein [Confluentibacter flavum]|uniref:Alpha-L-fucosidase n=1 Tax=Confluentibacter flavum TaxID=1909700 RepID=A0A2N3HIC0_9FLAO|nr:glycoside hydrolase family 95 protein [Confluentibacter flavum]PKQ44632.1 alpha-L-fucosidase [Confluentibacter flavum]